MRIEVGPTGRLVQGDTMDVSMKPFVRSLKELDPLLYVRWNAQKLKGWGCWEIRRKPEYNTVVEVAPIGDATIVRLEAAEIDFVNVVLNCAFLNYDQIRKLKAMDTWQYGPDKQTSVQNWLNEIDYQEAKGAELQRDEANKRKQYAMKHYKKELGELKEAFRSGWNPAQIADYWQRVKELD